MLRKEIEELRKTQSSETTSPVNSTQPDSAHHGTITQLQLELGNKNETLQEVGQKLKDMMQQFELVERQNQALATELLRWQQEYQNIASQTSFVPSDPAPSIPRPIVN